MICKCGCKREFELDKAYRGSGQNRLYFSKKCGQKYRGKLRQKRGRTPTHLAFGSPEPRPGAKNG